MNPFFFCAVFTSFAMFTLANGACHSPNFFFVGSKAFLDGVTTAS